MCELLNFETVEKERFYAANCLNERLNENRGQWWRTKTCWLVGWLGFNGTFNTE